MTELLKGETLAWCHSEVGVIHLAKRPQLFLNEPLMLFSSFYFIFLMCIGVFACMCVCVKVSELLELQLRTGVSHHVGAGN